MRSLKSRPLLFWSNYAIVLGVLTTFALFGGYGRFGHYVFSWLIWSDLSQDVGTVVSLFVIPLVALSPFLVLARVVTIRVFELIFFLIFVKLLLMLGLNVMGMQFSSDFGNYVYSGSGAAFTCWLLVSSAESPVKESIYLMSIGLLSLVAALQILGHMAFYAV